jgi:hypothetical protein
MGAESTWNFKKKLLLVSLRSWLILAISYDFFLVSANMTLHVSFECWWVPILDKPIYDVLFQNLLFPLKENA